MFKHDNYNNQWDGTHYKNESELREGVYYYILTLERKKESLKGDVTLIR